MTTTVLHLRISPEEKAELETTAQTLRTTVTSYVRSRLFGPASIRPAGQAKAEPVPTRTRPEPKAPRSAAPRTATREPRESAPLGHGERCACIGCRAGRGGG